MSQWCLLTEEVNYLSWSHEEADTKILYHLRSIQTDNNHVLQTNETDYLIIGLSAMEKLAEGVNGWIEAGVQWTNSQQFISWKQLYVTLGKTFCQSLPGYHAFARWHYTASFSRRGKVKALKILETNVNFQQVFYDISVIPTITALINVLFNEITWLMYGKKKCKNVDYARL